MAMQTGIGLGRLILIVGAGYTGTIVYRNGNLSDILADLQALASKKKGDQDGDGDLSDALASQVRRMAMEVRHLASRPITVVHGDSGQGGNVTALIMPAATLGLVGYGYMWWKGFSFSDLMYVTKENMANAVSKMKKHLDHVTAELAAAKRHLTQRIDSMDGKLDEQKEISKDIKKGVDYARGQVSGIGDKLDILRGLASQLDEKISSIEDKQNYGLMGVAYLLQFTAANGGKVPGKLSDLLQDVPKPRGYLANTETKGLQFLTDNKVENVQAERKSNSKSLSRSSSLQS